MVSGGEKESLFLDFQHHSAWFKGNTCSFIHAFICQMIIDPSTDTS